MARNPSKLSPKLQPVFDRFINHSNKFDPRPYDWDRFYSFLCASHRLRSNLSGFELSQLLLAHGFPDDVASEMSSVYEHGRAILRKNKHGDAFIAYPGQPHDALRREFRRQLEERDIRLHRLKLFCRWHPGLLTFWNTCRSTIWPSTLWS